jgi:hypothetical protein
MIALKTTEVIMDRQLAQVLEARRLAAGKGGPPMSWRRWGDKMGVMYTTLFRFCVKDDKTLGIEAIRSLAQVARANDDNELLMALAGYALDVDIASIVEDTLAFATSYNDVGGPAVRPWEIRGPI